MQFSLLIVLIGIMKKVISLASFLLSFSVFFSFAAPSYAASVTESLSGNTLTTTASLNQNDVNVANNGTCTFPQGGVVSWHVIPIFRNDFGDFVDQSISPGGFDTPTGYYPLPSNSSPITFSFQTDISNAIANGATIVSSQVVLQSVDGDCFSQPESHFFHFSSLPATWYTSPTFLSSIPDSTINAGDTYTASGSFYDTESTTFNATVNYGDGSGSQQLNLTGTTLNLSHQYNTAGTYNVTVTITDSHGETGTLGATITVIATAPAVGTITVGPNPVQINTPTTATASFTDPAGGSTDTASWDWGDGSSSSGTVSESNGSGNVTDNHIYTTAGVYTVTLTVTNPTDSHSTTQTYQFVSAYEVTSSGRLAGAKEFSSPAGAYATNTSLTGPVSFGLGYKYQGGIPTGDKQFMVSFSAANLNFNATSVSSLVISGSTATLEGSGTINGSGTYNFTVVGVDNGNIRVQITDPSNNNAVIYDTQPGDPLTATPTTPITKGSGITVHN
jgi:PKD repeat protein